LDRAPARHIDKSREAAAGGDFSRGGGLLAGLAINEQYLYLTPSYTFETPVLRGQLALALTFSAGRSDSSVQAVLSGPGGRSISGTASDSASGISDLYPVALLKWQLGVHNFMSYSLASVPTGQLGLTPPAKEGPEVGTSDRCPTGTPDE
jgi:hypothetical protein